MTKECAIRFCEYIAENNDHFDESWKEAKKLAGWC